MLALPVLIIPLLCSCVATREFLSDQVGAGELRYLVSIHKLCSPAEKGTKFARQVVAPDGRPFWVRSIPLVSSASFPAVHAVESDGLPTVEALLDPHGRFLWMQACAEEAGDEAAIVLDGLLVGVIRIPAAPENTIKVSAHWSDDQVQKIVEWAPRNYRRIKKR